MMLTTMTNLGSDHRWLDRWTLLPPCGSSWKEETAQKDWRPVARSQDRQHAACAPNGSAETYGVASGEAARHMGTSHYYYSPLLFRECSLRGSGATGTSQGHPPPGPPLNTLGRSDAFEYYPLCWNRYLREGQ
jgi:hypothetical protein